MAERAVYKIPRQEELGSLSISDLLYTKIPDIEDLCNEADPTKAPPQKSDMEDFGDAEKETSGIADLKLDVDTASNLLDISEDGTIASRSEAPQNGPDTPGRFQWPQVLSCQNFSSGRHFWEVNGESHSWMVGMCHPSIDRNQWQSVIGNNPKSWCLVRSGDQYSVMHDKEELRLPGKVSSNRVRIHLDYKAGQISFYELCETTRHLHTFTACFTEPLHAALCVWEGWMTTSGRPIMGDVHQEVMGDGGLTLDVDTAYNKLMISHDRKTASWSYHWQTRPNTLKRFHQPQVLSCQRFSSGQHYWEVDIGASDSWRVGMCYPSMDRGEWQSVIGNNHKSWCLVHFRSCYFAVHDSNEILLPEKISCHRFRIFVDYEAGQLSFYALSEPIRHLHTFTATFIEPLHAALWVWLGCIRISGGLNSEDLEKTSESLKGENLILDVNTANNLVHLSDGGKMASWSYENQYRPETSMRFQDYPQVLSSQSFSSGQHFWDVDVGSSYSWRAGMCYPSIDRGGKPGSAMGSNDKSWSLNMDGGQYSAGHAGNTTELPNCTSSNKVRIYLDYEAGQLSFYELRDPIRHLHTFTANFTEPLHAIVCVWEGSIRVSGGALVEESEASKE